MVESRQVLPNPAGGWRVRKPGAQRSSSLHDTQEDAIDAGRRILRNAGGGELLVHGRDGKVQRKDTVGPGNDTYPPRG